MSLKQSNEITVKIKVILEEFYKIIEDKGFKRQESIRMKVLTIRQPWATLIMQGDKRFEFRSWQTKYRGDLLIHAGKGIDKEAMKRLEKYLPKELPLGKILGKVTLVDCVKMTSEFKKELLKENSDIYTDSSFKENYGWKLECVDVFNELIDVKGKLSLWEYNIEK